MTGIAMHKALVGLSLGDDHPQYLRKISSLALFNTSSNEVHFLVPVFFDGGDVHSSHKIEIDATALDAFLVSTAGAVQKFRVDTDTDVTYLSSNQVIADGGSFEIRNTTVIDRHAYAGNHTVTASETVLSFTAAATCTLPAANATSSRLLVVKDGTGGAGAVVVSAAGGDTIDGAGSITLPAKGSWWGISDGVNTWETL